MNTARKFITKLMIIVLALILTDQLLGRWLTHAFARIREGDIGRMNYSIDSTTAPILVIGSSRAVHNYVTPILTDSLHIDCYDAGLNGQNLLYPEAILSIIFQRYQPQTIILDLKPDGFISPLDDFVMLDVLLPYYHTHPVIQPILGKKSRWEHWKTLSLFYCFKSMTPEIIAHSVLETDSTCQGYVPKFVTLFGPPNIEFHEDQLSDTPDTTLVGAFQNIISLVKQHHSRLIVTISPVYYPLQHGSSTIRAATEICRRAHIPFLDYSNAPGFANQYNLFMDATHLSDSGARKFTRILAADLHNSE